MSQSQNYIINTTEVVIDSYTDQIQMPKRANIYGVKGKIDLFSPDTIMNILINGTLKLDENIARPNISENLRILIRSNDANIYLLMSNLKLNNINVYKDVANEYGIFSIFIKPLYLQEKNVTITNASFKTTGYILFTNDPMSFYANNIFIDFHANMAGIIIMSSCNYPEANKTGMIYANNLTVVNAAERVAYIRYGVLIHNGGNDMTISNSYFDLYSPLVNSRCMATKYLNPTCFPNDGIIQKVSVINTTWTMPINPYGDRFICFYCNWDSGYYRKIVLTYSNNLHKDILNARYSAPFLIASPLSTLVIQNNEYINVSTVFGALYSTRSDTVLLENNFYIDSESMGSGTFSFKDTNEVVMRNITHKNLNSTGKSSLRFLYVSIKNGGNFTGENLFFENVDFQTSQSIVIDGNLDVYRLNFLNYTNVRVGNKNSLISLNSFKFLSISN